MWHVKLNAVYLFGGELDTEDDAIANSSSPGVRTVDFFEKRPVCYISAGPQHCASLTPDGDVYVWESSESEQMGYTENERSPGYHQGKRERDRDRDRELLEEECPSFHLSLRYSSRAFIDGQKTAP